MTDNLKLDGDSEWLSTYQMCEAVLAGRDTLENDAFCPSGLKEFLLDATEWDHLSALVELCRPVAVAAGELAIPECPTMQFALSALSLLLAHLGSVSASEMVIHQWITVNDRSIGRLIDRLIDRSIDRSIN